MKPSHALVARKAGAQRPWEVTCGRRPEFWLRALFPQIRRIEYHVRLYMEGQGSILKRGRGGRLSAGLDSPGAQVPSCSD